MRGRIAVGLMLYMAGCVATMQAQDDVTAYFIGKSGASLKQTISAVCRPVQLVPGDMQTGKWAAFRSTDVNADGTVCDRYSDNRYEFPPDGFSSADGMSVDYPVKSSCWGENPVYGDSITRDLFNLIPCDLEVFEQRNDYFIGEVGTVRYTNGVSVIGTSMIGGDDVLFFQPAEEYRGDFARMIMYMVTVYSLDRWKDKVSLFFESNNPLTFSRYYKSLMLAWHREDPVSDMERKRNDAVERIQGNRNPYVDYPELVEHVWGDKSDETFEVEGAKVPLRPVYTMADERIYLYSPYIPDDAVWYVDSRKTDETCLLTKELGAGVHELRYETATKRGKLKIRITQ